MDEVEYDGSYYSAAALLDLTEILPCEDGEGGFLAVCQPDKPLLQVLGATGGCRPAVMFLDSNTCRTFLLGTDRGTAIRARRLMRLAGQELEPIAPVRLTAAQRDAKFLASCGIVADITPVMGDL